MLTGGENDIQTSTINMLYPPKMITLTSSSNVIGGSVSVINDDFTIVMVLLSGLILFSIILILLSLFIKERFSKSRKATFFYSYFNFDCLYWFVLLCYVYGYKYWSRWIYGFWRYLSFYSRKDSECKSSMQLGSWYWFYFGCSFIDCLVFINFYKEEIAQIIMLNSLFSAYNGFIFVKLLYYIIENI